jgi:hypothetical protein
MSRVRLRARISRAWPAATILFGATLSGQDAFLERWREISARQPAGVTFEIAAPKTQFYLGEAIPLELRFTASPAQRFQADTRQYDRVGRMNYIEEFVVAPAALIEDPLQGLAGGSGAMGGISGGPVELSEKPFAFERVLNEWARFKQPGDFRVYVVSRRVGAMAEPVHTGKQVELVSNVLTLRIQPAPEAWVKQQIESARRMLRDPGAGAERVLAVRTLRYLASPDAAAEMVRALEDGQDVDAFLSYAGVLGSPYRKQLLPMMEQRLTAPDQPVWERYLDTLAELASLVEGRPDARLQKQNEYAAKLIAARPRKQAQARAVSLNTLLNLAGRGGPEPPWLHSIAASLIADFRSLPVTMQMNLLEHRWSAVKGPAIVPMLREILAQSPTGRFEPSVVDIALRRLYELSPEEGREIILQEIRQPARHLAFATLAMLPDATLPELDDRLAERLEDLVIVRYASRNVVKRVEAAFEARIADIRKQKLPSCSGPLLFYFLKFDPPYGERLLHEEFAREGSAPACYDIGFQFGSLGRWAYSPALERVAIASLTSPKVPVKRGAAEVLGKYGSKEAQKPLWGAMEYFRSWWKGREAELEARGAFDNAQLERTLRIALGQADAWVLQEVELDRLAALCSTAWCRTEISGWSTQAKQPMAVGVTPYLGEWRYTVAQYGPGDEEWLAKKVRQFPPGARFKMQRWGAEPSDAREARERGETVVRAAGGLLEQ